MRHHITRATRHLIFWSLVMVALSLTAVRLLLLGIDNYKTTLETRIASFTGAPVSLGRLGANMRGVSPELIVNDVVIASSQSSAQPAIHLQEIRLGINLRELLLSRDILASSWVTLVGAKLSIIRTQEGQVVIEGLKAGGGEPLWLLQGRQYEILQSQVRWQDQMTQSAPLVLDDVNLVVMNNGTHHQINAMTTLPGKATDTLKIVADFDVAPGKFSALKGKLYLEGSNVSLPTLVSTYLPFDIKMHAGALNFKLWSQWQQAKPVAIRADLQIKQGQFSRKGNPDFPMRQLDTLLNWQGDASQWQLDIDRFLLETPEPSLKTSKKWPDANVRLAVGSATATRPATVKILAKQLDLAEAHLLLPFFGPLTTEQTKLVNQSKLSGLIQDFSLYAEPDTNSYAVATQFSALGVEMLQPSFSFKNVKGAMKASDTFGVVDIDSQDVYMDTKSLFDKPIPVQQVKGLLAWQQLADQWLFSTQSMTFDCAAFNSESRLLLKLPKAVDKSPFIDLQTALTSDDLSHIKDYLPTKIIKKAVKDWLDPAFVAGKMTQGKVLFYGNANEFPFTDNAGVFEATLDLQKLEMNFNPDWLHLVGVDGRIRFDRADITGSLTQGKLGGANITKTEVKIPNLGSRDERIFIKGEAQGEVGEILKTLQQSPLATKITQVTKATRTKGPAKVSVDLAIPLWEGQELVANGEVLLDKNQLTVNQLGLDIDKINGVLLFNKNGIYANKIRAFTLGQPITVNIDQAAQQTSIHVDGFANVSDVARLFGWSKSKIAEGGSTYQLQLKLPNSQVTDPVSVSVTSALKGVALELPGSLSKNKEESRSATVEIGLNDEHTLPIALDYDNELKAAIMLATKEQKINSGHILIGDGVVKQRKVPGIKLEVNRETLSVQDWWEMASSQQQNTSAVDVNEIKIHSQAAILDKTQLGVFDLDIVRGTDFWSGEIDSALARGKFQFPVEKMSNKPVTANLEMINLTALKQLKMQNASYSNASEFNPLINLQSRKALWQSKDLGQLVLVTQNTPNGMNIKRLELTGDHEKLLLTGDWQKTANQSITNLKGQLEMKMADEFFDKLNITKDITGASGVMDFKLNWNAAPWQLSLDDLRGTMDAKLNSGRILSIEPGFGRVLGILAVAQWIKRLQLDFGDIYQEGLTFDTIEGHFDLFKGKAVTKGLVIDAVPAKITLVGDTDLVNQTVNYDIKVVPKSLDAVPIAGTIVSRIAAFIGKTLTGKDQEGFFFGMQYLVKGKWDDIKISSQHENDGLFQKTWNSITDFPWQDKQQDQ